MSLETVIIAVTEDFNICFFFRVTTTAVLLLQPTTPPHHPRLCYSSVLPKYIMLFILYCMDLDAVLD